MAPTVVFITGAGRGIGNGLVHAYLERPNHIVIGSVRDSASPSYDDLKKSPAAEGSRLILVTLDASNLDDPAKAIKAAEDAGIDHIDVVLASAGVSPAPAPLQSADLKEVADTLNINTLSIAALYQASKVLLDKSTRPVFVSLSSAAGSIANLPQYHAHWLLGYGMSKAALDWLTRAIHAAHPNWIAYAVHPGLVQTELGNGGARAQGLEKAPVTVEDSCNKIIASIDNATREKTSGIFLNVVDGTELPW